MSGDRINKETLNDQLPAILREQFRQDGLPNDYLPSWDYVRANTRYSAYGLNLKCQELYDQSLHEFLRKKGFGTQNTGRYPTDDEETIRSLEYYRDSLETNAKWSETTLDSVDTALNKVYEAIREEELGVELLDMARYDTEAERQEQVQFAKTIIEYMERDLDENGVPNYGYYFKKYYTIVSNRFRVDFNPVIHALKEFNWIRNSDEVDTITKSQLNDLWNALDALTKCPVRNYELDQWRLWMKMLIVVMIAVGPRSNEVEQLDVKRQFHFGEDPHVHFDERKNLQRNEGPQKVPIMFGAGFLEAYRDYIEAVDENGSLVPSPESQSGCRTPATLNNWLKRLCRITDVRLSDGSLPTIQNFRQFWVTRYKDAIHENRAQLEIVSEEKGTKNPEVDENNYMDDKENRRHIRELGRKHFEDVLDLGDLPDVVQDELDQGNYINRQTMISEFSTGT